MWYFDPLIVAATASNAVTTGGWLSEEQIRASHEHSDHRRKRLAELEATITLAYQRLTGKLSAEPIIGGIAAELPAELVVQAEKLAKQLVEKSKTSAKLAAKNRAIIAELKRLANEIAEQQAEEEAIVLLLA